MPDKPKCPYCGPWNGHPDGVEMIPLMDGWEGVTLTTNHYHMCPVCKTSSPKRKNAEAALHHALRRFQPMQKPLTLEEAKALGGGYFEQHPESKDDDEGFCEVLFNSDDEWSSVVLLAGSCESVDEFGVRYGKTWRLWRSKPTAEERAAAKWEEEKT